MREYDYSNGWIRHGRARLNLAMRLASRGHAVLANGGAAKGPLRTGAAIASAGIDVTLSRRLARSDRSEVALHGAVNLADLAAWTTLSKRTGPYRLASPLGSGNALAIEAGARYGSWGLAVPAAGALANALIERRRGRPAYSVAFIWQVFAALGGAGLSRYARRLRAGRLAPYEAALAPELSRAELAGLSDQAIGLDNVLDAAQRAAVLVEMSIDAPTNRAGLWKADLAGRTRNTHHYLVDVLTGWEQRRNRAPDLSRVVHLLPSPELSPVIVSTGEAAELEALLDQLDLRGYLPVDPAASSARQADRLGLQFGDQLVELDVGPPLEPLTFDPLPGAFGWSALWLAAAAPQVGVPSTMALGPAAAALAAMIWAHKSGEPSHAAPRNPAVLYSTALTLASALAQTATMRHSHVDADTPNVPVSLALRGHAFVTALSWPDLSPAVRVAAWVGGTAALVGAWAMTPEPRPVREFVAELSWAAMAATMAQAFTEGIERDSADVEAQVRSDADRRLVEARERGRREVHGVARTALDDAEQLFARHAVSLDPALRDETRRRLDDCARRLAIL